MMMMMMMCRVKPSWNVGRAERRGTDRCSSSATSISTTCSPHCSAAMPDCSAGGVANWRVTATVVLSTTATAADRCDVPTAERWTTTTSSPSTLCSLASPRQPAIRTPPESRPASAPGLREQDWTGLRVTRRLKSRISSRDRLSPNLYAN